MDSRHSAVASSGALENISTYLNGALVNLSGALHDSNEYITENLGVHPSLVYGTLAACVALPLTMSRYGFSFGREQSSPYSSQPGGAPNVTEDDYDYITSQDLDAVDAGLSGRPQQVPAPSPDDDVLLIKNKGVTYPAHFPAYSISDGRLLVKDVQDRIGLMIGMSQRRTRRVRLLYKGKLLKEPSAPIRDYRLKNNSELMAVVPDNVPNGSETEEEMVIVNEAGPSDGKSRKRRKKRSSKKKGERGDEDSGSSPRDGNSNADGQKSPPPAPGELGHKKLDELNDEFTTKWLPMCDQFIASPPTDPKKREDEHRKLSETVLQHILLKTDEVDTEGNQDVRARRKALVKSVQDVLKKLDTAKGS